MPKLIHTVFAAALGLGVAAPLYAADAMPNYQSELDKCKRLGEGSEQAKCITNIRPTAAASDNRTAATGASSAGRVTDASNTEVNAVKDGTANEDVDFNAAMKECDGAEPGADRERCIDRAKEHFGRM
jgi:predicted lipid-binding transport protein (Tim44 family)